MAKLEERTLWMDAGLKFNGMQNSLDANVQESIESYRKRERALKKLEELSRKDAWAVAMGIRVMVSRQARLWQRICYERYDFDLQRWLAKDDPTDFYSLTKPRSSAEAAAAVRHILTYAFWEALRTLTAAVDEVLTVQGADRDRVTCAVYVGWLRCYQRSADWYQYYLNLPPALREQLLVDEAGWAGSQLNSNLNPRLHTALNGWGGSVSENLAQGLPGAVLAAYGALAEDEQHSGSFLTQIAKDLENMGGESTSRPGKLTSLPPDEALRAPEDEQMAELERKEILDALEQAAGLSPQQAAVWQRLRRGMRISEIAAELGVSENSVSVQKHNAIKKLKEAKRAAEL
jgi:RNA polymerase sigma factor (sigma-70 family)